jgi:hypothetical protein
VSGARLTRLQTVSSGGQFPVSLTARAGLLYVLNAGGTGNVTGYRINRVGHLVPLPGASRNLGLGNEPVRSSSRRPPTSPSPQTART